MPTPTYWSSEEKLPIGQTKVSIPSDNGLSYQGGQRVIFTVPDSIEYINPINTVLEADFKIDLPAGGQASTDSDAGWTQTRLMLDAELGGSVLIRHIRVYANSAEMPLLDEVQDCNVLAAVRYDYHSTDNERKKRALTEGCTMYTPEQRNDRALDQSSYVNSVNNTYFDANRDGDNDGPTKFNAGGAGFKTAKLLLPLHESGIFGSSVVFPNKLVGGLRLELELAEASDVVRQLDTVQLNTNLEANPIFHSVDGLDAGGAPGQWTAASASATDVFFVARQNSNDSIDKFPFCIGERMSMKFAGQSLSDNFIIWKNATDNDIYPRINKIELQAATAGQTFDLIKITLDTACYPSVNLPSAANNTGGKCINTLSNIHLYSLALTGGNAALPAVSGFNVKYTLSNANLLVERVDMPSGYTGKMLSAMKQGGVLNYDFLTFTNYKYSQQKDDRVANVRIPISNKRCKGVICCPVDSSVYSNMEKIGCGNTYEVNGALQTFTYEIERVGSLSNADKTRGDHANHSKRSGLTGCVDGLTRYQFFYDGKLNPSRPVVTSKIADRVSIAQQPLVELEKCLAVCGIPPSSFKQFRSNFVVGRATGLQSGVADLSTTDFSLQVEFQEQGNAPTKPKLWNIFTGHLRRLMIKGDSVMVDV